MKMHRLGRGELVALAGVLWMSASVGAARAEGRGDGIYFDFASTTAGAGRTRVIAFHATPAEADRSLAASVADAGKLIIVEAPAILAGAEIGYVRVRGVAPGRTTLSIGGTVLNVEVAERRSYRAVPEPAIVQPGAGAVVWGTFSVGVDVDESEFDMADGPVRLRLSNGTVVDAAGVTPLSLGPTRHYHFKVDASQVEVGPLDLSVVMGPDGHEVPGSKGVRVRVARPQAGAVTVIEAEASFEGERPERFRRARVVLGRDEKASGGAFVNSASSDPAACLAFKVEEPGMYQVIVNAAADFAGGAYPTVGLIVDGGQQPVTNARLCAAAWHRTPLGTPVRLEAGERVLTPYFLNDFYADRLADRNLRLDSIEVLRVGGGAASGGGDGGAMMGGGMSMMGGGMGDDAGMGGSMDDPMGSTNSPLRVAFSRPFEGQVISGSMDFEGLCFFPGSEGQEVAVPPVVTLLVNGEPVSSQWSAIPRFTVDARRFKSGDNTVQLLARRGRAEARTTVQTLMLPAFLQVPHDAEDLPRFERFTVQDPRWGEKMKERVRRDEGGQNRAVAEFFSNGEETLNIPDAFAGEFDLYIDARGTELKGPPVATIRLAESGGDPFLIKEFPITGRVESRKVATISLKPGPKRLSVAFENDAYEEGKGDRNFFLRGITLVPAHTTADTAAPVARIEYPAAGAACFGVDAVVVSAADDRGLAGVELIIDGGATGVRVDVARTSGRIVLPLITRSLTPGTHTLAVKAVDTAENAATAEAITFTVLAAPPAKLGTYDRAIRLLDRFAFGPDQDSLAAILTQGESAWLSAQLGATLDTPGDLAAFASATTRFPRTGEAQRRAIAHAITTPNPVRARFVLWAENHFSTWLRKTEGERKWDEHIAFSRLGVAPFEDLLSTSAHSPAMLRYLDQEGSYARRLNENYAREIMELHTLGVHGGYVQQDVTNLARLLTGWTTSRDGDARSAGEINEYTFRFDPGLNDRKGARLLGFDFPNVDKEHAYARVEHVLETLAAHPSTPRFVCTKIVEHYLACPAPEGVVNDLADVFEETNGDMKAVLLALAKHPAFWAADDGSSPGAFPAQRLAHPQGFAVRLARAVPRTAAGRSANLVADFLGRAGQQFFDRPTPDGYSERDIDYTDSNAMIQRWKLAQEIAEPLTNTLPEALRTNVPPTSRTGAKRSAQADPREVGVLPEEQWRQQVIDLLAVRLTGRLLSERSNAAADTLLAELTGRRNERLQSFVPLMAQLPEANLR